MHTGATLEVTLICTLMVCSELELPATPPQGPSERGEAPHHTSGAPPSNGWLTRNHHQVTGALATADLLNICAMLTCRHQPMPGPRCVLSAALVPCTTWMLATRPRMGVSTGVMCHKQALDGTKWLGTGARPEHDVRGSTWRTMRAHTSLFVIMPSYTTCVPMAEECGRFEADQMLINTTKH